MKKVLTIIALMASASPLFAQKFDWNVGIDYNFINSEYTPSKNLFEKSGTLNLANFRAEVGFVFDKEKNTKHTVRGGTFYSKDMGTSFNEINKEWLFYYQLDKKTTWGNFSAIFGSFPASFSEGDYCEVIKSAENKAIDVAYEGMFFKYKEKAFFAELGLDWFSKYGTNRRERFQILTAGSWSITDWLQLGWDASMYHFATSTTLKNVVDNVLAHPYIKYAPQTGFDKLSISAGWIQKYDWDRQYPDQKFFNGGALAVVEVERWGVGIKNDFFFGQDMMPNFIHDDNYIIYGTDLYQGNIFYHTQISGFSFYNKLDVYYSTSIGGRVKIKAGAMAHFGNPTERFSFFRGWQQYASVTVNLDKFRN